MTEITWERVGSRRGLTAGLMAAGLLAMASPSAAQEGTPPPPEKTEANGADRKVLLAWEAPNPMYYDDWDGPAVSSYQYRVRTETGSYPSAWTAIAELFPPFGGVYNHPVETLADGTRLSNGSTYFFEMRSVNSLGAGDASEEFGDMYSSPVANTPATYEIDAEVGHLIRYEGGPAVPRVPALLTITLSGAVDDGNGKQLAVDGRDSRFNWRWQWIRVRDGVETEIPGAIGGTLGHEYRLTPDDVGSQIKARMRWRDDYLNDEEFVSPPFGPILAAAACPTPNLAGGRTVLWTEEVEVQQLDPAGEDELRLGVNEELSGTRTAGDYTLTEVYHATEGADAGKLVLKLGAEMSEEDQRQLALHVCDEVYPLIRDRDPLGNPMPRDVYKWAIGRDWSDLVTRTLHLSRDTGPPVVESVQLVPSLLDGAADRAMLITFDEALGNKVPDESGFTVEVGSPEFISTSYVFDLLTGRDGSSEAVHLGTVEANHPGGSVEYELTAGDTSLFAVDGSSGAVTYIGPGENLDPGRYELTVRAADSESVEHSITLSGDGIYVTPTEPLPAGYSTLTLGYSIPEYHFAIEDPAWNKTQDFTVDVPYTRTGPPRTGPPTRPSPPRATATVVIRVTAGAAFEFISTPYVFNLPLGRDGSSVAVPLGTVEANHPDGGSVEYELTGGDTSLFAVDGSSGAVTYIGTGESRDPGRYELTVQATDADGDTATADVEIRVTVGAAPEFISTLYVFDLPPGRDGSSVPVPLGTVEANHPDYNVEYELTAGDTSLFAVDGSSGAVTYIGTGESGETGRYELTVQATDPDGDTDTATVVIRVTAGAAPEFISTPYVFDLPPGRDGSSVAVPLGTVVANDPDGGSVVYELTGGDTSLFAVDGSSGAVTYIGTGESGETGRYELTVQATDPDGVTATATVVIRVTAGPDPPVTGPDPPVTVDDPPLAVDDAAETDEDTPVTIAVLANDSSPGGDTLTVTEVSAPAHGTAARTAAGAVLYTPGPNFNGTDRFTYVVGDGSGLTAEAAVEVTVRPVDDPPEAVDDAAETTEDTPVTIAVLANDSDPDGDTLTVAEVSAPEHGTAVRTAAGAVRYTPGPNFDGTDRFTYVVRDGSGLTAEAAVAVTVRPVDDPPEAVDDAAETAEDTPVTIAVLANDSDPDGDTLTVAEVSAPEHGTAVLTEAGTVQYAPEPDYHGADRFTYVVSSGSGLTARASVAVTVLPANDPPEAVDDAAEAAEDTRVTIAVLDNDSDPDGDALTVAEISTPAHGAARLTGAGAVEYTPDPDYHGPDGFTYVVGDGSGLTAQASVAVTVLPVNDPPQVVGVIPDQALEAGDGPASLDLGPYFDDRDGDALGYTAAASDPAVALSLAGATLTLTVARPGAATVTVTAEDLGGLTAEQAFMVTTTDRQARGVLEDTLAAMGRGHLASARATLGRRVAATGREESRVTVAGMHVPLGTDDATAAGRGLAERWITGLAGGMGAGAGAFGPGGAGLGGLGPGGAGGFGLAGPGAFGPAGPGGFGPAGPGGFGPAGPGAFGLAGPGLGGAGGAPVGAAGPGRRGAGASSAFSGLSPFGGGHGQTEFQLALGEQAGDGAQPGRRWTVWGQVDQQAFQGQRSPTARYDGALRTAWVGVDARLGQRWLAGLAVARSNADSGWSFGSSTGRLTTRLTSLQPYLRWADGGTSIWATAGGGRGSAENERTHYGLLEASGLAMRMGLVEVRRRLATVGPGVEVALRGDASWAQLATADGGELIDALAADVHQLRVGVDLSRLLRTAGGTSVEPFGEVHARHDGGSGQTGAGLEVAGGLRVARGAFRLEGMGRLLGLHAAESYREHGAAVTLSVGEGARRPGLTLSLSPRWGASATASDALWRDQLFHRQTPGALGAGPDEGALDTRVDYGLQLPSGGLLTPFGLYGRSPYGQRLQAGLLLDRLGPLGLEVSGERHALPQQGRDEYRMTVLGSITFGGPDAAPGR